MSKSVTTVSLRFMVAAFKCLSFRIRFLVLMSCWLLFKSYSEGFNFWILILNSYFCHNLLKDIFEALKTVNKTMVLRSLLWKTLNNSSLTKLVKLFAAKAWLQQSLFGRLQHELQYTFDLRIELFRKLPLSVLKNLTAFCWR